jgi:hypothetical protein
MRCWHPCRGAIPFSISDRGCRFAQPPAPEEHDTPQSDKNRRKSVFLPELCTRVPGCWGANFRDPCRGRNEDPCPKARCRITDAGAGSVDHVGDASSVDDCCRRPPMNGCTVPFRIPRRFLDPKGAKTASGLWSLWNAFVAHNYVEFNRDSPCFLQ